MGEFKLMVPTYNGKWLEQPNCELEDFSEPEVPVLVRPAEGVRIVLGTHDYEDTAKPDVQIERRHNGWMIFLHPLGGSDACGFVVFLDDGRSFIAKEHGHGPTEQIEMVEYQQAIAELDDVLPSGCSCAPTIIVEMPPVEKASLSQPHPPGNSVLATEPIARPQCPISQDVIDALERAQDALHGDSNDDEHDALLAIVEALDACNLVEHSQCCPEEIVTDFCTWAGLDHDDPPDQLDLEDYVRLARPPNSSPLDVSLILREWADAIPKKSADIRPKL